MTKIDLNTLSGYAVLLLIGVVTSTIGIFLVIKFQNTNNHQTQQPTTSTIPVVIEPQPSQYPDFDSLGKLHRLQIVNDFISWTPDADKNKKIAKKVLVIQKGEISKAYLYVSASLNKKALTQWESIFIQMNYKGGHLFRPKTLPVPPSDKTKLLYALNYIPYLSSPPYSEQRIPLTTSWFEMFKDKSKINIETFISSLRPALIEDISLYYECIDTKDSNPDSCSIVIQE